jgi:hypothetical protein
MSAAKTSADGTGARLEARPAATLGTNSVANSQTPAAIASARANEAEDAETLIAMATTRAMKTA